jgi:hypothetical protein
MPVRPSHPGSRRLAAVALAGTSLVAAAALGSLFLSTAREAWTAASAAGPAGPADGILLLVGMAGALLSLWLGLGLALSALSALPGTLGRLCRGLAGRIAPAAVRKVVAFTLGTTLTAALIPGTAVADERYGTARPAVVAAAPYEVRAVGAVVVAAPDASFRLVGDRPQAVDLDAAPSATWSQSRREIPADEVVVLRGDTLWSIAARHLGPAATAAEISAEWHRWMITNRDVIGPDCDLILPGQQLRAPVSPRAAS